MPELRDLEIGVMFWAARDPLIEIRGLGVRCGQLGVADGTALIPAFASEWKMALAREDFTLVTVFCAYSGESYADIPTVRRTVGFIPPDTRQERVRRTLDVSDFAASIGVASIACHVGFVPEDRSSPDYIAVRDIVRSVCDHAAANDQTFALETGQEPAATLLRFLEDVERDNLKINFDPANMILYGTGDPIAAFEAVAPHVVSVHAKDGDWPPKDRPGALGVELPLGEGSVDIPRFMETLKRCGYRGTVNVEREIEDQRQRIADLANGVKLLKKLR